MRVIDTHVHLYPAAINAAPAAWAAAADEPHWANLATRRRRDGRPVQGFPDCDALLRGMDRAGLERAVLLGWYWQRPENCIRQNRFYAGCIRDYPDRLSAFATVHPRAGREPVLAELQRAHDDGLIGLGELSPHSQGYGIDDPGLRAALQRAGELGLPVNLHVTDPFGRDYPGRVTTPLEDFLQLARDFPAVTFILAHWGGRLPALFPEAIGMPNLLYDTAASPLLYDDEVWKTMPALVGPDRVLFGSDYPLNLYPKLDAVPDPARFVTAARQAGAPPGMMGLNAVRLLGV